MRIMVPSALWLTVVVAIATSPRPSFSDILNSREKQVEHPHYEHWAIPAGTKLIGNLDTRQVIGQIGIPVDVSGWAVATKGSPSLREIEIFMDGRATGIAYTGRERQDVAAVYARNDFLYSGWSGQLDLKQFALGRHIIECKANLSDGSITSLGTGVLLVTE